jgi:hypothetical protein
MSRLIDKLTRTKKAEPQPMGFMLSKPAVEKPRMQLIAYLSRENLDKLSALSDTADAVMVEVAKSDDLDALEKVCQDKDKFIGGGWLKVSGGGTSKKAISAACDFMVFPPATAVSLVPRDKTGCILELDPSLSDSLLRTASDLPIDAVMVPGKDAAGPLTLERLMAFQRVAYLVGKPILVSIPAGYSEAEMQALWDMGISAVVVEPAGDKSQEKLAELRKVIEKLAPPASKKQDRTRAILPQLQPEPETAEEGDGDGEEEEDE